METKAPKPDITIIAYVAVNDIQHLSDKDKQISRYVRSFRYEHHDALIMRRLAFNRLLDEKEGRMFGSDGNPEQQLKGLSMFMEYLAPYENGKNDTRELKKLHLLTGEPMSSQQQLERWQKELCLLQAAFPENAYPVVTAKEGNTEYDTLDTPYWTSMYYFYE
jgi:hypothetical protein